MRRAVGMAWQRRAGTQPAEQGHCRRTQPADSPPGTGLKTSSQQLAGLAAKTTAADKVGRPLAVQCRLMGGSARVLALRKAGSDLPTLSLPHLPPLPVTVSTHSLNLETPNLAPTYFFVIFLFLSLYFPTITRPLTPFTVLVRLTYSVT